MTCAMRARSRLLTLLALLSVLAAACGGGTTAPGLEAGADEGEEADAAGSELDGLSMEELAERAAEEGEVVVYSFTSRIAEVETAFEEAYPEVDLIGLDISSTEQITRLQAEAEAGVAEADVAYISDAPVVIGDLVEEGILTRYVPPDVADTVPQEFTEPLLSNRLSTKVLMYNEEAHPDGPPVDNLWALTEPEWRGRVVSVDPLVRGDYLDLMTEIAMQDEAMAQAHEEHFGQPAENPDEAGEQWIRDLFANEPVLVDDTDNVNAAIGAVGQADPPIGFTSYSDRRDNEDEGWALQVAEGVQPAVGITFPALLGLVRDAPHPAAARLAIAFLMGDDSETGGPGYEPFYVAGDYAARDNITDHPDALPLDELNAWQIDPAALYEERDQIADLVLTLQ